MGKRASVYTFIGGVHASRCLTHLTRGCILPARKMFLDLSEPRRASDRIPSTFKNVHGLFGVRSFRRSRAPNRKNVLGPILEPPLSSTHCVDPKNVLDLSGVRSTHWSHAATGKMFLDLSRIHVSSRSHFVNLKNVHEPIWNSPCSGLHSLDPNNVLKTDMVFRRIARSARSCALTLQHGHCGNRWTSGDIAEHGD